MSPRKRSPELRATGLSCTPRLLFRGPECPVDRLPLPGPGIQPTAAEGTACLRVVMTFRAAGRRAAVSRQADDGEPQHAGPGTVELCP